MNIIEEHNMSWNIEDTYENWVFVIRLALNVLIL